MKPKGTELEMERLSSLFLSMESKDPHKGKALYLPADISSGQEQQGVYKEEKVQIKREVVYPNIPPAQAEIKRYLLRLLKDNYRIISVKLKKREEVPESAKRVVYEEKIFIHVKGSSP